LENGVLRYERRQELLRAASHLGINRFDASLLIASIQHRRHASDAPDDPASSPDGSSRVAMFAALTVQGLIVMAAFKLLSL
jgi:hypothetical protein